MGMEPTNESVARICSAWEQIFIMAKNILHWQTKLVIFKEHQ